MDKYQAVFRVVLIIFSVIVITRALFTVQQESQALTINPMQNCIIKAATPVRVKYNDYPNKNCINSKLRINEPFGIYTPRDGFMKWEILYRAHDCNFNYFHHLKCNITALMPRISTSVEINVWENCSFKYIVNQRQARKYLPDEQIMWQQP